MTQTRNTHPNLVMLGLAFPMILANITTPILGLVDTAVLGHMSSPAMLAGASIATLIISQIYWVCGFLRMSSTGLSAQAKGDPVHSRDKSAAVLAQTCAIGLLLGVVLIAAQWPVLEVGLALSAPSEEVAKYMGDYFYIRIWGAPAALVNMALVGWLVGQQLTRAVLLTQIAGNLINALLDIGFVYGLGLSVEGVALATLIAEYSMAMIATYIALRHIRGAAFDRNWFNRSARKLLVSLNSNMLIRNLALQLCLAFLTMMGARYGAQSAAVNAILLQFFVLIALGLDGIAYAVEALIGEAKGAGDPRRIVNHTLRGLLWSSVFALIYACLFTFFGQTIIGLLTEHDAVKLAAQAYLPLIILLPLVGHWCFLFDGVFVGLTQSRAMRDTMLLSALCVFFPVWFVSQQSGNIALWYALLAFLFMRGLSLSAIFLLAVRRHTLIQ